MRLWLLPANECLKVKASQDVCKKCLGRLRLLPKDGVSFQTSQQIYPILNGRMNEQWPIRMDLRILAFHSDRCKIRLDLFIGYA